MEITEDDICAHLLYMYSMRVDRILGWGMHVCITVVRMCRYIKLPLSSWQLLGVPPLLLSPVNRPFIQLQHVTSRWRFLHRKSSSVLSDDCWCSTIGVKQNLLECHIILTAFVLKPLLKHKKDEGLQFDHLHILYHKPPKLFPANSSSFISI